MEASQVFEEKKHSEMQIIDHASIAAAEAAKARVQAAYIMAYKNPRNADQSRIGILEACKRPAFAERVKYSKPVSGKPITGPSIRFAETALRIWGNILIDTQVLYEDDNIKRTKVLCIDLETNTQFSKDISIQKTTERKKADGRDIIKSRMNSYNETVYIVRATEDEVHNKEAALISKAIRNEGLRLIPSDIVDEALDVADDTIRNHDAEDPAAAKKKILDSFSEIGVYPKDIEKYLGHKIDSISPVELKDLRGVFRAIRDGESTWQSYVEDKAAEVKPPKPASDIKENLRKEREQAQNHKSIGAMRGSALQNMARDAGITNLQVAGIIGRDVPQEWGDLNDDEYDKVKIVIDEVKRSKAKK